MSTINDGGPAFPLPPITDPKTGEATCLHQWGTYMENCAGMSLRAYFAGQAMVGLIASNADISTMNAAHWAVAHADALIARDVFEVVAMIGRQELYPVACYGNSVHVFECGLRDYLRRTIVAHTAQQEGTRHA